MTVAWIPILLVFFVLVVILAGIYVYKHKKELMRERFPDMAEAENKKKPRNPRPNARRHPKPNPHRPVDPEPVVARKKKAAPKPAVATSEEEGEENRISDITIDTENTALASMALSPNGALLVCACRDRTAFLFAVTCLEVQMYPLTQHFTVVDGDVTQLIAIQPEGGLRVVYNENRRKTIDSCSIAFEDDVKAFVSPCPFTSHSYRSSIQKLCASEQSDMIVLITDRQLIRVLDSAGTQIYEHTLPDKKCSDAVLTTAFDRLIIAYGAAVHVFAVEAEEIVFQGAASLPAQVVSVTYSETKQQIIAACADGLVLVLKKDYTEGPAMRFNSTGVRIVTASPKTDFFAIISQRAKMQIVNLESGRSTASSRPSTGERPTSWNGPQGGLGSSPRPGVLSYVITRP
jgi:WD40 repeat protein